MMVQGDMAANICCLSYVSKKGIISDLALLYWQTIKS